MKDYEEEIIRMGKFKDRLKKWETDTDKAEPYPYDFYPYNKEKIKRLSLIIHEQMIKIERGE